MLSQKLHNISCTAFAVWYANIVFLIIIEHSINMQKHDLLKKFLSCMVRVNVVQLTLDKATFVIYNGSC